MMPIRPSAFAAATLSLAALVATPAQAEDPVDFEKQVLPILEERCIECHQKTSRNERGRLKKPKGGLRLDGAKFYAMGGGNQEDEGKKVISAGKADESTLYTFTTLPEDDDLAMPPKDERLTDEQKDILKRWINEGAKFGDWTGDETEFEE